MHAARSRARPRPTDAEAPNPSGFRVPRPGRCGARPMSGDGRVLVGVCYWSSRANRLRSLR